jgi:hypothetical protein
LALARVAKTVFDPAIMSAALDSVLKVFDDMVDGYTASFIFDDSSTGQPSDLLVEVYEAKALRDHWDGIRHCFPSLYPVRILAGASDTVKARYGAPLVWCKPRLALRKRFRGLEGCMLSLGVSQEDFDAYFTTLGTAMRAFQDGWESWTRAYDESRSRQR